MTAPLSDHLLKVADLLERPGASREVDFRLPVPDDLATPVAATAGPARFEGVIESVVDGLLVRGLLRADLSLACARCLRPLQREASVDVVELFMDPADLDPDDEIDPGYEIQDGHLDLGALLRDSLSSAIPYRPLCRGECRGLCAECGADRNVVDCDCADRETDPRWEALRHLHLPES